MKRIDRGRVTLKAHGRRVECDCRNFCGPRGDRRRAFYRRAVFLALDQVFSGFCWQVRAGDPAGRKRPATGGRPERVGYGIVVVVLILADSDEQPGLAHRQTDVRWYDDYAGQQRRTSGMNDKTWQEHQDEPRQQRY